MSLLHPPHARPAPADHAIDNTLLHRWSPRAFSAQPLEPAELARLFEAARWAPSASNTQPWAFVHVLRGDPAMPVFLSCLNPGNAIWAQHAAVLVLALARREAGNPPKALAHARYDLGQAVAHLSLQATSMGLAVHQMAGFDAGKAHAAVAAPADFDAVTMIAVGWPGDPSALPDEVRQKDAKPRNRLPQRHFVFHTRWSEPGEPA